MGIILTILCHGTQASSSDGKTDNIVTQLDKYLVGHVKRAHHVYCTPGPGSNEMPHLWGKEFVYENGEIYQTVHSRHVIASKRYIFSDAQDAFDKDTKKATKLAIEDFNSIRFRSAAGKTLIKMGDDLDAYRETDLNKMTIENTWKYAYAPSRKKTQANFVAGNLGGVGTSSTLTDCLNFIQAHETAGEVVDKINLVGWSRGGVQCVRIAEYIQNGEITSAQGAIRRIPCNIFAIDPVPGHRQEKNYSSVASLPDNVEKYVSVIAIHDKRNATFKPLYETMQYPNPGRVLHLPIPGDHSTGAFSSNSVGKIVRHMIIKFLARNGSVLTEGPGLTEAIILTPTEAIKEWDKAWAKGPNSGVKFHHRYNFYLSNFKHSIMNEGYAQQRAIYDDKGFFYNAHHYATLKTVHPTAAGVAKSVLENHARDKNHAKFEDLQGTAPNHYTRIKALAEDKKNSHRDRTLCTELSKDKLPKNSIASVIKLQEWGLAEFGPMT